MTVTPAVNADLGVYSIAVGSAQLLTNGDYHFDAGLVPKGYVSSAYSIEVDPTGKIVYKAVANSVLYRTFRRTSLYLNY